MEIAAPRTAGRVRGAAVLSVWRRSPGAGALATLATAVTLTGLAVVTTGRGWGVPVADQLVVDAAVGLTYPLIGAVVAAAPAVGRGTRALAWVLLASGVAAGLTTMATAFVAVATQATPGVATLAQLQSWLWVPGFLPLLTLVPLLYPDGLPRGRIWRWAARAAVVGMGLLAAGVALHPEPLVGRVVIEKPVASAAAAQLLAAPGGALLVVTSLAALTSLGLRLRASSGLRRRQIAVLVAAAAALVAVTVLQGVIPSPADVVAQSAAVAFLPVAIGVAVTRHRLYDLDVVVCRALVALSLAACLTGLYLAVFALAQALAPGRSALSSAVAAGATGVVVHPLARRLSAGVDRLFYGDRADPYAVSTRLSSKLATSGLDVAEVPQVVCETLLESLRLGSAQVDLLIDGAGLPVAGAGEPGGRTEAFEMRHRGEPVGWLRVTLRPGEAGLDARDAEILTAVADQAAPALAALQLHAELQRSREALVAGREEERLLLRRDLHDGLGATLAGLRLQVESAQALVDDPATRRLLDGAAHGVSHAVSEVRTITDGLRPPAIDELGLALALAALAERATTLTVRTDIAPLPPLAPATEVAAYRIAAEALTNAAKHAGASTVSLHVRMEEGAHLVVDVTDDGNGLGHKAAGDRSGLGMASMRQRAEEIGGSFEVTSARSATPARRTGTQVRAVLPVAAPESTR